MNRINKRIKQAVAVLTIGTALAGCQKMDRPPLGDYPLDPPPPPYSTLKNFWGFEGNTADSGQYRAKGIASNISYVTGIAGQGALIGDKGFLVMNSINDSLKNPGSLTVAFWMNGTGPVTTGAEGLFAIAKSTEFWGNVEMFLENLDGGDTAYLKVHLFNTGASDGIGEEWNETKIPNALNKWTHIAVTYNADNSQFSIYANGQPTDVYQKVLGDGSYGPLKFSDVSGMAVGSYAFQTTPNLANHGPEDWAKSFVGTLDQFRVYNVALSDAEVLELFNDKK